MLGLYEFVKRGDPPVMGLTKMTEGMTLEDMKRPRVKLSAPLEDLAARDTPASLPGHLPGLAASAPSPTAQTSL